MQPSESYRGPTRPEHIDNHRQTPSTLYDKEYFLTACEGHDGFARGFKGEFASPRLAAALRVTNANPGERILDIGCGRGEATLCCARNGATVYGLDYSLDAMSIARRSLAAQATEWSRNIRFLRGDAKELPFEAGWFDKLLMFDLVEHLYPWELKRALDEAWRVLADGGQLIVHTAPNRWYYRFGYPLYRAFERLRGRRLPRNPRNRFPCHHLHVNEQDILRLRRALDAAGFRSQVWLENIQPPLSDEASWALQTLLRVLLDVYPFRWIFRNDIFAVADKQG